LTYLRVNAAQMSLIEVVERKGEEKNLFEIIENKKKRNRGEVGEKIQERRAGGGKG